MSSNSTNNSVIRKEQTNTSGNVTSAIDEDNTTLIQTSSSDTNLNENKKIIDESKEGSSLNLITTSTSTITKPSNDELNTNSTSKIDANSTTIANCNEYDTINGTKAIIPHCRDRKFVKLDARSLHKYFFQYYPVGTLMYLPHHFVIDSIGKAPPSWEAKKKKSIKQAIDDTYLSMIQSNFDESVQSCDEYNAEDPRWQILESEEDKAFEYEKDDFSNMITSLENNYCFDIGFKILDQASETNTSCLCPCCPLMETWKEENSISSLGGNDLSCDLTAYVTPTNLIRHLVAMKKNKAWFHAGILKYLELLYSNVIPDVNDKGVYYDHYAVSYGLEKKEYRRTVRNVLSKYMWLPFNFNKKSIMEFQDDFGAMVVCCDKPSIPRKNKDSVSVDEINEVNSSNDTVLEFDTSNDEPQPSDNIKAISSSTTTLPASKVIKKRKLRASIIMGAGTIWTNQIKDLTTEVALTILAEGEVE